MASGPGPEVLEAFQISGQTVPLVGGEGRSVQVGDAVLKPADDPEFVDWLGPTMSGIVEDGFRISRPLQTTTGAWHHAGWTASRYVAGTEPDHDAEPRWLDIIEAGRAFHRALAGVARPDFLDRRDNWWQTGDHVAFQERQVDLVPGLQAPYNDLVALLKPITEPAQLVHGDLTGNVLFAPGLPPAIIDFSPYWRPTAFGEAVVVGDALIWHGADTRLIHDASAGHDETGQDETQFLQYVARAVIFRLVTTSARMRSEAVEQPTPSARAEFGRYERATKLVTDLARTSR